MVSDDFLTKYFLPLTQDLSRQAKQLERVVVNSEIYVKRAEESSRAIQSHGSALSELRASLDRLHDRLDGMPPADALRVTLCRVNEEMYPTWLHRQAAARVREELREQGVRDRASAWVWLESWKGVLLLIATACSAVGGVLYGVLKAYGKIP